MTSLPRTTPRILAAAVLCATLSAACSDQPKVEEKPAQPLVLSSDELLGVDSSQVTLSVPWNEGVVSHDPGPGQVRATLASVTVSSTSGFGRAAFEFLPYSSLPGYRVVWDSLPSGCRIKPNVPAGHRILVVSLWPTMPADTIAKPKPAPGSESGPEGISAAQFCRQVDELTWTVAAPAQAPVRVTELRDPPRLLVDVRKAAPAAAPTVPEDSAAAKK